MITRRNFSEYEKEKARKNTFILIGITGKGKSQIIKFLTGDPNAKVSNNKNSCTSYSSLYYGAVSNGANGEELICMVDTAGLCDSNGPIQDRQNYNDIKNVLIQNNCEIKGIFIIENFQDERLDGEERKVIKAASDLFPLEKFWTYTTFVFTHYYNKGSTNKVHIKKEQIGPFCESLTNIMKQIKERIPTIKSVDPQSINKIYINIDNNVIEKKGFNFDDEEENELYEQGLKDLEKAKKALYEEILGKIKLEPLYDEVKDMGTKKFILRKEVDTFNYNIYEVEIEIRNFYRKKKLIFSDFIFVQAPKFVETVNKALFHIKKVGKGALFVSTAIVSIIDYPVFKGICFFTGDDFEFIPTMAGIYEELFPNETEKEHRTKLY